MEITDANPIETTLVGAPASLVNKIEFEGHECQSSCYYFYHFISEKIKAQGSQVSFPKFCSHCFMTQKPMFLMTSKESIIGVVKVESFLPFIVEQ